MMLRNALVRLVIACALGSAGCAHAPLLNTTVPTAALPGTDGVAHSIYAGSPAGRFTAIVFFAQHCPCQAAHDARLATLASLYRDRGVDLFVVDPEVDASVERDRAEVARRGYPFPILIDKGAALAHRLGAEYATETFIVDAQGVVRYHGGIDSDKNTLHEGARPYLRDALEDLVEGRGPRLAEAKTLGCALQIW